MMLQKRVRGPEELVQFHLRGTLTSELNVLTFHHLIEFETFQTKAQMSALRGRLRASQRISRIHLLGRMKYLHKISHQSIQ